jgi:hypothetical protein
MKTTGIVKKYQVPLIITGVALAGYLGYKWYRKRNPTDESSLSADEKAAKAKGQALSYTLTSYQGLANTIYNAWFQRFNPFNAVDETIVLSVMDKMKNDLDVLQLIRAFGKRRSPVNFASLLVPDVTLPEWLSIGLEPNELKAVNDVLAKKGISFKF